MKTRKTVKGHIHGQVTSHYPVSGKTFCDCGKKLPDFFRPAYTPGPWKFNVIDSRGMIEGRDQLVAYVDQVKVIDGHLLAAAPELLEALKEIQEEFAAGRSLGIQPGSSYAIKVRDLIAKAEGK